MSELYHVIVRVVTPGYEPATLTTPAAWADALHRRHVEIVTAIAPTHAPEPHLTDDDGIYDVHAPEPSRLTQLEIEQERVGDALAEVTARLARLEGRPASRYRYKYEAAPTALIDKPGGE